ncbi:hypothetical protein [Pedobacter jeongneungensis]|uniref:hypothetical protein n=1 Tax=Pedobacter jeongneungensis TaxID=947309 RepID=UPI0004689A70|nr:hypothetical protein [Pedobacter jeongneungensis]
MKDKYPVLKTKYFELSKNDDIIETSFGNPHLVVGIILPEGSKQVEEILNKSNLLPYELACRAFNSSDYQYSVLDVVQAKSRVFKGFQLAVAESKSTSDFIPLVISYLQFSL